VPEISFLVSPLDVRDDPKLFDFGLATEFRPEEVENGTYKLTGDTGTIRYMAPEGEKMFLLCSLASLFHSL
jgi:serine/threonine protein kinase